MIELRGHRAFVVESPYLLRRPEDVKSPPLVLFLHGFGDTPDGFAARLGVLTVPGAALLFAGGPVPVEVPAGQESRRIGQSWYCYDGDQDRFRDSLEEVESYLDTLLDEVKAKQGVDTDRTVVVGYSQGAYVAGFYALRRRPRPLGLALVAGRLKHEFVDREIEGAGGLPVFLAHGDKDEHFPRSEAEVGQRKLASAGALLTDFVHDGGHGLTPEVFLRLGEWLGTVLGS